MPVVLLTIGPQRLWSAPELKRISAAANNAHLLLTLPDPFAEAPSTALKVGHHGQRINGVQGFPNDI